MWLLQQQPTLPQPQQRGAAEATAAPACSHVAAAAAAETADAVEMGAAAAAGRAMLPEEQRRLDARGRCDGSTKP